VLADVHGNLPALGAAIAVLRAAGVDRWVCAGDIVGYGPHPNECVEAIAGLGALCVAGNHEALALGDGPPATGPLADALRWTRAALSPDCRAYLEGLPSVAAAPGLVVAHASLDDPRRYVRRDADAADQLRRLASGHPGARVLVLGHTHRQWVYGEDGGTRRAGRGPVALSGTGRFLLNPGAVGQSRQREFRPRARFMLLDAARWEATLFSSGYDLAAVRRALRREGLPRRAVHLRPPTLPTPRRVRRLARRLRHRGSR
jgi:predicted phosphodiesterase